MDVTNAIVTNKKARKTPPHRSASPHPASSLAVELSSEEALPERTDSFDPRLLLTKLSAGKSSSEYQADESIFSQGDEADAVYYIQRGKVKLTVVSKTGKEAVVAILQESSFFGEGCLAGQTLRMATASVVVEQSTIVRVEKRAMVALLHQEPEFAERFLAY